VQYSVKKDFGVKMLNILKQ